MNYKTHMIGGIGAGVLAFPVAASILGVEHSTNLLSLAGGVSVFAGILGATVPDIDHKGSYIGKKIKIISCLISSAFGHRGLTHAPLVNTVLLACSLYLVKAPDIYWYSLLFGFFGGIYSHILLDGFTKGGIPLFYPFTKKKFSLGLLVTGGKGEKVFRTILSIGVFLIAAKLI